MCRIISIVNMKGGVGKSTTAVNLGIGLAKQGKKVLLLDCDSQGSLTASLGFRKPSLLEPSIATVMASIIEEDEIQDPILHHREGVDLVPANETLKGVELALVNVMSRELIPKEYVTGLRPRYDYILLDCAPSLGLITINALACADSVLIPVQAAKLALDGLQELIRTIRKIRRQINPDLTIEGVLITMVNPRTRYARRRWKCSETHTGIRSIFFGNISLIQSGWRRHRRNTGGRRQHLQTRRKRQGCRCLSGTDKGGARQ